jgi:transposase
LVELREILHEHGNGKQGRSRSPASNASALLQIHTIQQLGHSFDESIKATAQSQLASPNTLRKTWQQFQESSTLSMEDRRNCSCHPFYQEMGPSLEAEILIHRLLEAVKTDNVFESLNTIRDSLVSELTIRISKATAHRWLHSLGYKYGKKLFSPHPMSYRNHLIRQYIYKYSRALKEQQDGTAVIVYMDESYIHSHHCSLKTWYAVKSSTQNIIRGDSRGKRIIIMHAMTKDGLLELHGVEPSNILTELYHSCALIFDEVCVDGITPADYHDTINGDKFIGWIQNRLIPTFQRRFGKRKKMILVLDNAKYHHHRGPDWFSTSNKSRGQLADFLRQRGIQSITVDEGRVIPSSKFSADARGKSSTGPTLKQLKKAVDDHLVEHPEINTTVPQQLMADKQYELLYTPPYVSHLQPIELIWAHTKSLVARQSHRTRTAQEAAVQTREAMEQVDAEYCQKVIRHCHDWIEGFMKSDDGHSLQTYASLQALIDSKSAEESESEDEATVDQSEEEQEEKAQWLA